MKGKNGSIGLRNREAPRRLRAGRTGAGPCAPGSPGEAMPPRGGRVKAGGTASPPLEGDWRRRFPPKVRNESGTAFDRKTPLMGTAAHGRFFVFSRRAAKAGRAFFRLSRRKGGQGVFPSVAPQRRAGRFSVCRVPSERSECLRISANSSQLTRPETPPPGAVWKSCCCTPASGPCGALVLLSQSEIHRPLDFPALPPENRH